MPKNPQMASSDIGQVDMEVNWQKRMTMARTNNKVTTKKLKDGSHSAEFTGGTKECECVDATAARKGMKIPKK
jgi:hypothetical protein